MTVIFRTFYFMWAAVIGQCTVVCQLCLFLVLYSHTSLRVMVLERASGLIPLSCASARSPKQSSLFGLRKEQGQNNNSLSVCRNSASLSDRLHCLLLSLKSLQCGSTERTINTHNTDVHWPERTPSPAMFWTEFELCVGVHTQKSTRTFYTLHTTSVNFS